MRWFPEDHLITRWIDGRYWLEGTIYLLLSFTAIWGLVQHGTQKEGLIPAQGDFVYGLRQQLQERIAAVVQQQPGHGHE